MVLALAACARDPEPVTVYEPVEVKVPVIMPCPAPEVPPVNGPDFAPPDATIFEAAQYAAARIIALRAAVKGLRESLKACTEIETASP